MYVSSEPTGNCTASHQESPPMDSRTLRRPFIILSHFYVYMPTAYQRIMNVATTVVSSRPGFGELREHVAADGSAVVAGVVEGLRSVCGLSNRPSRVWTERSSTYELDPVRRSYALTTVCP